jgi:TRAP-type mannitol/chloroaromatic compound transport system permease small subunit
MVRNKLLTLQEIIEKVVEWTGVVACFLAVPLCLLVVFEVCLRIVSTPTIWSFEVGLMLFGAHYFLLGAYGLKYKSHAVIDIFTAHAARKTNRILQLICYILLFFPFTIGVFYLSVPYALDSWKVFETSWSMWGQPLYIVKSVMPVATFLLIIQGIAEVIKIIYPRNEEVKQ